MGVLGCIKLSFLFFYRRIFCSAHAIIFNYITLFSISITAVWAVAFFFAFLFSCGHAIDSHWSSRLVVMTKCNDPHALQLGLAVSDFIMDCFIILMPIPMLWNLRISLGQKIALTGVFMLGALATASSAARMVIYIIAVQAGFTPGIDPDVEFTDSLYWVLFECGFALIASCLPTLRFLFVGFSPNTILSRTKKSTISQHSSSHSQPSSQQRCSYGDEC